MHDIKAVADYLLKNDNYYIIVHKNPDGDCLGSAKAICLALRKIGKNARVILPNSVSPRLSFMWDASLEEGDFPCNVALCTDVASFGQMGDLYEAVFKPAPESVCIDHHGTNMGYAGLNLIDASCAATGEIIFDLIRTMNIDPDEAMATALLISIADDSGCFQYSNTTARTHRVAAELYEIIPNPEPVMRALYGTHTRAELDTLTRLMPNFEYHMDGRVCFVTADVSAIEAIGAHRSDIDAWVSLPRSVNGVEVAAVFKVISANEVKVSFRSNDYVDVSALAAEFGGGGHVRAAGATFFEDATRAKQRVLAALEDMI